MNLAIPLDMIKNSKPKTKITEARTLLNGYLSQWLYIKPADIKFCKYQKV